MEGEAASPHSAHEDKMCRRCFSLFQHATDLILSTHASEQALVAQCVTEIEQALDLLVTLIKPRSKAHNSLAQEIKAALQETVLDKQPYSGLRTAMKKIENTNDSCSQSCKSGQITDCHVPAMQSNNKENIDMNQMKPVAPPVEHVVKQEAKKFSIFSCQSSREDKNLTVNIKNLYETASFNKVYSSISEKNIKVTQPEMSEIDKRIKELEEEKCRAEEERFVAQLPSTYSVFTKKRSIYVEGKSLEMNTTVETAINQMSVNDTQELKPPRTEEHSTLEHLKSDIASQKGSKKQDLMALVYKVNNKMIDFDKFDRKKSRPCFKENKAETKFTFKVQNRTNSDQEAKTPTPKPDPSPTTTLNFNKRRLTPTPCKMEGRKGGIEKSSKTPDVDKRPTDRPIASPLLKLALSKPN